MQCRLWHMKCVCRKGTGWSCDREGESLGALGGIPVTQQRPGGLLVAGKASISPSEFLY